MKNYTYPMKLALLNCPACNSTLDAKINLNRPFNCPACGSMIVSTDWTTAGQLICGQCHTINAGANKYCDQCNQLLQAGCPFCYTQNSVQAIGCKKCGVNLQKAWGSQQTWLKQREKFEEEHKNALKELSETQNAQLKRLLIQLDNPANHPAAIPGISIIGREAIEPLIKLLTSKDPDARYGAAHALGNIGDERAIPPLIKALDDPEAAVRYWTIDALGKLKADQAVDALGKMLHDEDENVGKYAKNALQKIGTAHARQILRESSKPKWWPLL
jgi:hypothetical protein